MISRIGLYMLRARRAMIASDLNWRETVGQAQIARERQRLAELDARISRALPATAQAIAAGVERQAKKGILA